MLAKGTSAGVPIAGSVSPLPGDRLFEVRTHRAPAAQQGPQALGGEPASKLGHGSPRDPVRRGGHHRPRGLSRSDQKPSAESRGIKLTFLPFVVKACAAALKEFPHFNSSLDHSGENLILKQYVHIGVAVDTPNGLVVPVLRMRIERGSSSSPRSFRSSATRRETGSFGSMISRAGASASPAWVASAAPSSRPS